MDKTANEDLQPSRKSKKTSIITNDLSWTNKIVFDLSGVDPIGAQTAFDLVKKQIGDTGTAVLIDYFDDFKSECSRLIKFEKINY